MRGVLLIDRVVLQSLEVELGSVEERPNVGGRSCAYSRRSLPSPCIMCCLAEGTAGDILTYISIYTFVHRSVSSVQPYVFDIHVHMCVLSLIQVPTLQQGTF